MSNTIEWAHAGAGLTYLPPASLAEHSEDGNALADVGIYFGEGVIVYGQPEKLAALFERAAEAVRRDNAPALPELPIPADVEDDDEIACPHVEDGEPCGRVLEVQEKVWDYRPTRWGHDRDGGAVVVIGDGEFGDGEFVAFRCESGHEYELPASHDYA